MDSLARLIASRALFFVLSISFFSNTQCRKFSSTNNQRRSSMRAISFREQIKKSQKETRYAQKDYMACRTHSTRLLAAKIISAQSIERNPESLQQNYYHVEFVVSELNAEGNITSNRSFTGILRCEGHSADSLEFSVGSRIPITMNQATSSEKESQTQAHYTDVGIYIRAQDPHQVLGQLAFSLQVIVNNPDAASTRNPNMPVIIQNKLTGAVLVVPGKDNIVFHSDAVNGKGGMQVSVKADLIR